MLAVIIPWRETPTRKLLLPAVIECLAGQMPSKSVIKIASETGDAGFCKAKAVNDAVKLLDWTDRLIIHDADILVPGGYIERVQECFDAGWEFVKIGCDLQRLTCMQTEMYLQHPRPVEVLCSKYVHPDFPMGSVGITREAFVRMGGMNEIYVGWGFQDKSLLRQALALTKSYAKPEMRFVHLWHEIANQNTGNADRFKAERETASEEVATRNREENELCPT